MPSLTRPLKTWSFNYVWVIPSEAPGLSSLLMLISVLHFDFCHASNMRQNICQSLITISTLTHRVAIQLQHLQGGAFTKSFYKHVETSVITQAFQMCWRVPVTQEIRQTSCLHSHRHSMADQVKWCSHFLAWQKTATTQLLNQKKFLQSVTSSAF